MKRLIVRSERQIAELWNQQGLLRSYIVSTAANGLGCENGSYCTPFGKLKVAQKIGDGSPVGAIFRSRLYKGEVWCHSQTTLEDEDLVLTRILWLEGGELSNQNTLGRYIYLHGTNHEEKLGRPASHGCIRFSNLDIIEVFQELDIGSEVHIE